MDCDITYKRRWSNIELRSDIKSSLIIESIARYLDLNLETPRVRRRSQVRRSAINLINHPEFNLKDLEDEDRSCASEEYGDIYQCDDAGLVASKTSSLTTAPTISSSWSTSDLTKNNKMEDPSEIQPREQKKVQENKREESQLKTSIAPGSSSMGRRSISMPMGMSKLAKNISELQQGMSSSNNNEFYPNTSNHNGIFQTGVLGMLGQEIQTRYEKYREDQEKHREDQKIQETRKMILEAAKKREESNLMNLL